MTVRILTRAAASLAAWLTLALSAGAAAQTPYTASTPPLAEMMAQYRAIAFGGEMGPGRYRDRVIKWVGPVVIRLRGHGARRYRREVMRHLHVLARLTGLSFTVLPPGSRMRANMTVTFVYNGGRGPADRERACESWAYNTPDYVIYRAEVRISADWRRLRRHCITEEITQALGLLNDSNLIFPSIFNDNSHQQRLSAWDRMLVRAHYDPRIRPGMSWYYAAPIIRDNLTSQMGGIAATGMGFSR
jgi:hypothetical protein